MGLDAGRGNKLCNQLFQYQTKDMAINGSFLENISAGNLTGKQMVIVFQA